MEITKEKEELYKILAHSKNNEEIIEKICFANYHRLINIEKLLESISKQ